MSQHARASCHVSLAGVVAALCMVHAARAAVTISSAATSNMTCVSGVCSPTTANAVLNVGDLTSMLASGPVTVNTGTGSLAQQVQDIVVAATFNWASANALTLDAYRSVTFTAPVAVNGAAPVSLVTNDGGSGGNLSFMSGGNLSFLGTANNLSINGAAYTLENSIATLASAIAADSAGNFALANSYDASHDGTYANAAIPTEFSGKFEGLGNAISNLSLKGTGDPNDPVGLFAELALNKEPGGAIENILLQNFQTSGKGFVIGGLVGTNVGTIQGSFATGSIHTNVIGRGDGPTGLLVGVSSGTIARSGASGTIAVSKSAGAGGLVGSNDGTVLQSFADSTISVGSESGTGGLAGGNTGQIIQCYAVGSLQSGTHSETGGLVGDNGGESTISQSYSTAAVQGGGPKGGLIGTDYSPRGSNISTYWDTSTSGVTKRDRGAGNVNNDPGITGETTAQLQSGLPSGFDPTIWAESPSINNGLPYLIANPPQ